MTEEETVRNNIRTALKLPLQRPAHPDMERLGEILRRHDDRFKATSALEEGPFKASVEKIIDSDSLAYVARERAYRVIMMMEAMGGMPRGCSPGELRIKSMCMDFLATAWIDGAIMMATFERERPRPEDKA